MSLLEVKNLKIEFFIDEGFFPAVNKVDLNVKNGEVLAIIGESGCGKSITSLSILNLLPTVALISNDSEVIFKGRDISKISEDEIGKIRGKEIGMVFQEPMTSINPVFTIGNQVNEIFRTHFKLKKSEAKEKSIEILRKVHLPEPEKIYSMYPHELSGGMRQRVMIGMAIACNPSLLIADEPTTALDVTIQAEIMKLFAELRDNKKSIIFISHNLLLVKSFAHRIIIMYLGEVVEETHTHEIFENPLHPYTIGLLKAIPYLGLNEKLNEIPGSVPSLKNIPQKICRFYDRCDKKFEKCKTAHPDLYNHNGHKVRCFLYEKS